MRVQPGVALVLTIVLGLLGISLLKYIPAPYTLAVESSQGGRGVLSVVDWNGKQKPEAQVTIGNLPIRKTVWSANPLVLATMASDYPATLTVKRWGRVCAVANSKGGLLKSPDAECRAAPSWF